jgi:predicted MFS family arabinose efflux permease
MLLNRWAVLAVLFFARTAMGFQFQSIASVSPFLVHDLGIDLASLGVLVGAWMLPGVVVAIPGGLLGQRFGDKQVVVVGLLVMALGSLMVARGGTFEGVLAGRIVSGIGAVMLNVLLTKMVAEWFSSGGLATAMSLLVVSWPLGIGLSLAGLGPLAAAASWQLAIMVTAGVCLVAMVLVLVLYGRPPGESEAAAGAGLSWTLSRRELALTLTAGGVWALYNTAYIIVVSFSPVLLAEQGFGAANAAVVASLATWPLVATVPLGGALADRTGKGTWIMVGCILALAFVMPMMLIGPSPLFMLVAIGALAGPAAGIIMSLPGKALSPKARHLGMGIFYTLYYVAMAVLPSVAGWSRSSGDGPAAPLFFASAILLLATVLIWSFNRMFARP